MPVQDLAGRQAADRRVVHPRGFLRPEHLYFEPHGPQHRRDHPRQGGDDRSRCHERAYGRSAPHHAGLVVARACEFRDPARVDAQSRAAERLRTSWAPAHRALPSIACRWTRARRAVRLPADPGRPGRRYGPDGGARQSNSAGPAPRWAHRAGAAAAPDPQARPPDGGVHVQSELSAPRSRGQHGALNGRDGRISITWRIDQLAAERLLTLVWQERDVKMDATMPKRGGFGMELLSRSLPYDLEAETDVDLCSDRMRFELRMPLKEIQPRLSASCRTGCKFPGDHALHSYP